MLKFIFNIHSRNQALFYFGLVCLITAIVFLILTRISQIQVNNVNAWYKPFKFAFATCLYAWSMAWFCFYLKDFNITLFNYSVILLLGFEIVYIALQAGRGQQSHFNLSTPIYSALYSAMAIAATAVTLYTAYIALLFFKGSFPELPFSYLWGIRMGLIIFVIFSLEGFVMGSRLSHTIGAADGGGGLPLLNWSTKYGDPRVAHFIGMHALQVLPLLSFYLVRNYRLTLFIAFLYILLATFTLIQALKGKPFYKINKIRKDEIIQT